MQPSDIALDRNALGARLGEPVRITWLGCAGFAVAHAGYTILLDPYLTRASLGACAALRLRPDERAIVQYAPNADAIVVGHTHFDHALDVPLIARRTAATVYGSSSAARLCVAQGVDAARVHDVERVGRVVEDDVGPFRLRLVPSVHSKFMLGRVPFPGEIADCDDVPLRTPEYRCGAVFGCQLEVAGRTIFHLGSADLLETTRPSRPVDVLLMCVAGWTTTREFPERVFSAFRPKAIVLSHWDDFFRPLSAKVRALPAMRMAALVERLQRAEPSVRVGTLGLLGEVAI